MKVFPQIVSPGQRKGVVWVLALAAVCLAVWLERASRVDMAALDRPASAAVFDRHGELLRLTPDDRGERRLLLPPGDLPALVVQAFVLIEDRRFLAHPGVDPLSVLRAAVANAKAGRIVQGGSTLAMQLARLSHERGQGYVGKLVEAVRALRLQAALGHMGVLRAYLDMIPLGGNLVGVEAASLAYFNCPAKDVTPAQAAVLAALAAAPGRLRGDGDQLAARRDRVLARLYAAGQISGDDLDEAAQTAAHADIRLRDPAPWLSSGLSLSGQLAPGERVRTSLDAGLQRRISRLAAQHRERLLRLGCDQACVVVLRNEGREVLAATGGLVFGQGEGGFFDMSATRRAPGSTLKPFLYALALDAGHGATEYLSDVAKRYSTPAGEYAPSNFDRADNGPVTPREALANSLNLSTVSLADKVGPELLGATLASLELTPPGFDPASYGVGLAVGNVEVTPMSLAAAYATLADGGRFLPLRLRLDTATASAHQVFSAQSAAVVFDMLADRQARGRVFGSALDMPVDGTLAVKTGTSARYRDVWAVGLCRDITIVVWAGKPSGRPTPGLTGAQVSGLLLADVAREVFSSSYQALPPARPPGLREVMICSFSGMLPGPFCQQQRRELVTADNAPTQTCTFHTDASGLHHLPASFAHFVQKRRSASAAGRFTLQDDAAFSAQPTNASAVHLTTPLSGTRFVSPDATALPVAAKAVSSLATDELIWYVNGDEAARTRGLHEVVLELAPGFHRLTVADERGQGDEISVRVE